MGRESLPTTSTPLLEFTAAPKKRLPFNSSKDKKILLGLIALVIVATCLVVGLCGFGNYDCFNMGNGTEPATPIEP